MFDLGYSLADLRRALWAALFGAAAVLAAGETDWKVLAGAALAGALSAIKNGVLSDESPLK